jgi:hypothetical protein
MFCRTDWVTCPLSPELYQVITILSLTQTWRVIMKGHIDLKKIEDMNVKGKLLGEEVE